MGIFRKNQIDEFTKITRNGRDAYVYQERDHRLEFQVETQAVGPRKIIYASTVRAWLPPYEKDAITDEKRNEILKKIGVFFEVNGYTYVVLV